MNLNDKVGFLLDSGLTPDFIVSLNESVINALYERMNKKEVGEQATQSLQNVTKTTKTTDQYVVNPGGEMKVNGAIVSNKEGKTTVEMMEDDTINVVDDPDATADGMGMFETELGEKFESKAQQGLFWARCNKCKSENCKWCKMAKEFSKSTTKKDYKKMPEKKHPEKTVKYKKENKESFTFGDYSKKLQSVMSSQLGKQVNKSMRPTFMEGLTEERLEKIIQESLKPTMKKGDLLKLIENEIKKRKTINEDFYAEEIDEDYDFDFEMNEPFAPTKEPGIKEPKIKPSKPQEPEWSPEEDEPITPSPETDPEPQAKNKKHLIDKLKKEFDKEMIKMENITHKPHNFNKFK